MSNKKTGLGRGFESLIPENFTKDLLIDQREKIVRVSIDSIVADKDQPRKHFDEDLLRELTASIRQHGLLQPLIVTPIEKNKYQIIAGERRWRAARIAKIDALPVIIRTTKQLDRLELALVENVQRVDLSPLEQASSIQRLHDQFSQDYGVIAKRLGKAFTTIQNTVRLLQLPQAAKQALRDKEITEGHARAILSVRDENQQKELLKLIKTHKWSVRKAEQFAVAHKQGAKSTIAVQKKMASTTPLTDKLGGVLKTNVSIKRMAKGGKLEIAYKNEKDLDRIIKNIIKRQKST